MMEPTSVYIENDLNPMKIHDYLGRKLNNRYIYGIHDYEGYTLLKDGIGWVVTTDEIGHYQKDGRVVRGRDFSPISNRGHNVLARINYGYGDKGTIPGSKTQYGKFGSDVAKFVKNSTGCSRWIIGNEPNHEQERPSGNSINPQSYAECFNICYEKIKEVKEYHQVILAAIAPWTNATGDWLKYFDSVLDSVNTIDGIALHTYTHGSDPNLIFSDATMNPPYQSRFYNFRAFEDFMRRIPLKYKHVPVYITETNQYDPWLNQNNGWVKNAYDIIDMWNRERSNQKIYCLCLYRWNEYDKWNLKSKDQVHQDFREAMERKYEVPESHKPFYMVPYLVKVTASSLNVRNAPGIGIGSIIGTLEQDKTVLVIDETIVDTKKWLKIIFSGLNGWIYGDWTEKVGKEIKKKPIFDRILEFTLKWEGGFVNDPDDPGGATNKGITIGTYTEYRKGKGLPAPTVDDLKNITDEEVTDIYYHRYFIASNADDLPDKLAALHFDTAVLHGVGGANHFLKQTEEIKGIDETVKHYLGLRAISYFRMNHYPKFGRAWLNRVKDLHDFINQI